MYVTNAPARYRLLGSIVQASKCICACQCLYLNLYAMHIASGRSVSMAKSHPKKSRQIEQRHLKINCLHLNNK